MALRGLVGIGKAHIVALCCKDVLVILVPVAVLHEQAALHSPRHRHKDIVGSDVEQLERQVAVSLQVRRALKPGRVRHVVTEQYAQTSDAHW